MDMIPFDPAKAEVKQLEGAWKVVEGDKWLLDFGEFEGDARRAFQVIRHYNLTQQCFVSDEARLLMFFLADGTPPAGPFEGEQAIQFNPGKIEVRQLGGDWKIMDGDREIANLRGSERAARRALDLIRIYRFEYLCWVGQGENRMTYFRTRGELLQPNLTPAADLEKTTLKVIVVEGHKGAADSPRVTLRRASGPPNPVTLVENPAVFSVPPGACTVTVKVGAGEETAPKGVGLQPGKTTQLMINVGTGGLELTLMAGGKPLTRVPLVHLKRANLLIAAVSELPAKFQAPEGAYTVELNFLTGQSFTITNVVIAAGEVRKRTEEVPCATVIVSVSGGGYGAGGKFLNVEIQKDGKFVAALADNPARFQLLAGEYRVGVREGEKLVGVRDLTLKPGHDEKVEIKLGE